MTGETAAESSASVAGRWELPSIKILNPTLLHTENYAIWRLEAIIHLDNADVWEVVSGSEPKPTTDPHDNWKRKNRQARSLLIALVSGKYKNLIGNYEHTSAAWKALENTLDRKSVSSTIYPIYQVLYMQKDEYKTWNKYITEFESRWTNANSKVATATKDSKPWIRGFQSVFSDEEFKAHLLLSTLSSTMDNIVDNLQTKETLSYSDVWTRLLDLSSPDAAGSALMSHQKKKKNQTKSCLSTSSSLRPGIPPPKECSYCWKRNLLSKGHTYTDCAVLKKVFEEKKNAAGSVKIVQEKSDISQSFALVSSSSHTPPQRSMTSGIAHRSSETKTFEVWTFDTAATHHITIDFSVLQDPTLVSIGIEVGDGRVLQSTHKGTVLFDVDDGAGGSTSFSLSNVLYIPN